MTGPAGRHPGRRWETPRPPLHGFTKPDPVSENERAARGGDDEIVTRPDRAVRCTDTILAGEVSIEGVLDPSAIDIHGIPRPPRYPADRPTGGPVRQVF